MSKAKTSVRQGPLLDQDDPIAMSRTWRRPWIPYAIFIVILALVLGSGVAVGKALEANNPSALAGCKTSTLAGPHTYLARQPICILPNKTYTATLQTTAGVIVMKLFPENAPVTVNNFVVLAVKGYFNGLTFWDAQDWEVQAGDPLANGRGGPGYTLPEEGTPSLNWGPGAVGMARTPGGPVNGSQFFIMKAAWPNRGPGQVYNHFGSITTGLDKVSSIQSGDRIDTVTIKVS